MTEQLDFITKEITPTEAEPEEESRQTPQLYDSVEAIAARYETRRREIKAVTDAAEAAGLEMKEDYLTQHKRQTWREILDKSNARQWMTSKQDDEVSDKLYNNPEDLPEITVERLRAWLEDLVTACPDMIRDLCREAFEILTPQKRTNDNYKSNEDKREIPKSGRVVLTWMCEQDRRWNHTPRLSYHRNNKLNVLDRVFSLLDQRAKPEGNETAENLCRTASEHGQSEAVTFWGRLKMHFNGNLHIWLTRPDLVQRLTETAAGRTLSSKAA